VFIAAERDVERHSAELKKELRLFDLIWMQILNIVGLSWVGYAGRLGSSHVMYWIPAVVLFYIPSGIVVTHLLREMPLEGGIYQWAKLRFGALVGFLVAWNILIYQVLLASRIGLITADNIGYALGARGAGLESNKVLILGISVVVILGLMLVAWRGLGIGKWINNAGGFALMALFVGMIVVAIPRWLTGRWVTAPAALTFPAVTLLNVNIFAKLGFGALAGFDGVVVFAGECRDANVIKAIRRSMWVTAPAIAGMFILGTAAVLAFVKPDAMDLVSPITQALTLGAPPLAVISTALLVWAAIAGACLGFNLTIRLPMVAGWDHLLPGWFSRLHPKYKTPTGSVVFLGVLTFIFAIGASAGSGNQEAFQLLDNAAGIVFALAYMVMFAIPLVARGEKAPLGVRIAAVSGGLMTLLYLVLAVFPVIDVKNPGIFTAKLVAGIVVLQVLAVGYFRNAVRAGKA